MAPIYEPTEREQRVAGRLALVVVVAFLPGLVASNLAGSLIPVLVYGLLVLAMIVGTTAWVARRHGMSFGGAFAAIARRKPDST